MSAIEVYQKWKEMGGEVADDGFIHPLGVKERLMAEAAIPEDAFDSVIESGWIVSGDAEK